MTCDLKCVACDTPVVLLRMTGYCGTDDLSIECPHEKVEQDRNDAVLDRIKSADAKYLAALKAVIG